jgi:peptide/nickel transport system permease protein
MLARFPPSTDSPAIDANQIFLPSPDPIAREGAMVRFIVRRLVQGVVLLALLSVVVFLMIHLAPGDAAEFAVSTRANEEDIARYRHNMGLDLPWYQQYGRLASQWVRLDFGDSLIQKRPVGDIIKQRLPRTAELLGLSIVFSCCWRSRSGSSRR